MPRHATPHHTASRAARWTSGIVILILTISIILVIAQYSNTHNDTTHDNNDDNRNDNIGDNNIMARWTSGRTRPALPVVCPGFGLDRVRYSEHIVYYIISYVDRFFVRLEVMETGCKGPRCCTTIIYTNYYIYIYIYNSSVLSSILMHMPRYYYYGNRFKLSPAAGGVSRSRTARLRVYIRLMYITHVLYRYVCIYLCVCIYIYIYVCMCMYIYIYVLLKPESGPFVPSRRDATRRGAARRDANIISAHSVTCSIISCHVMSCHRI